MRKSENKSIDNIKLKFLVIRALFISYLLLNSGCNGIFQDSNAKDSNTLNPDSPKNIANLIIQSALSDPDPQVRSQAIEVVASTGRIMLMPKIQQLLEDEYAPVRFAAVLAIGDMEYSIAKDTVAKLLRDTDASVIAAAAYTMAKLGSTEYNRILYSAINSQDQTVRANAALLLGKSGDRNAIKPLYWAMQDKSSEDKVVYQAAESLAMLGDLAIYPKLWSMLISAYADVRVVGVRAMGVFGTRQAKEALATMLEDNILEVRLAAAGQLGAMGDTSGESVVLSVFEKDRTISLDTETNQRVYVLTALAIGQIKTPKLTKFLPQLLKNESKFVRIAAAKAVFQSGIE